MGDYNFVGPTRLEGRRVREGPIIKGRVAGKSSCSIILNRHDELSISVFAERAGFVEKDGSITSSLCNRVVEVLDLIISHAARVVVIPSQINRDVSTCLSSSQAGLSVLHLDNYFIYTVPRALNRHIKGAIGVTSP